VARSRKPGTPPIFTPVLKTIDRYIIRQFLGTFFFLLVLIMSIAVVFDISEKTEDFTSSNATLKEIAIDYYVNFVLYYSNFFSGLFIFLAVLLFTSRLAGRSEVIAMLSSGVSFPRFTRPYFIAATILTAISLYVNVFLLPVANRTRLAFEKAHIWNKYDIDDKNLLREISENVIVYMESIDMQSRTANRMSIVRWENGAIRSKLEAERAIYDSLSGRWQLFEYKLRVIPPDGDTLGSDSSHRHHAGIEHITRGERIDTLIPLKPSDLGQRLAIAGALDRHELAAFIKAEKMRGGSTVAYYEVEQHQRTASPFATFVFTLIGVGVASRKVRGGTGVHLVLGVMLILVFIFLGKLSTVAATNAGLNPFIAVWTPNVIFALIGVWIYWKAPK
jgi:lipopolysaccharide export system permease protein